MNIRAVSRKAGVSTATVSRVLNGSGKVREATEKRVRKAIDQLGYIRNNSARTLRVGRSNLYGIIVSDIRNPFFPDLIEHFESLADQHGIDVTFANTGYHDQRLLNVIRRLLERGIDGIALMTSEVSPQVLERLRSARVPVVFLNQPAAAKEFPSIVVDYEHGFAEAVDHLRMLGHRSIGFIAGPPSHSSAGRRREAFLAAIASSKLRFRKEWMLAGDHKLTGGQLAAARLFALPTPPTAIMCSNDLTALGFLHAAKSLGRDVPKEISVVGFDDLLLSEMVQPPLTTIRLSRQEIAARAFYALQSAPAARAQQSAPIIPSLVIRASTGPVPA